MNSRRKNNELSTETMPRLSVGRFALILSSLGGGTACATTITQPETTPVYAEELTPAAEPVEVEKSSVADPSPTPVAATEGNGDAPAKTTNEKVPDPKQSTETPAADDPETSGPQAPPPSEAKPEPVKQAMPAKKPLPKKTSAPKKKAEPEGGCGAGTCG